MSEASSKKEDEQWEEEQGTPASFGQGSSAEQCIKGGTHLEAKDSQENVLRQYFALRETGLFAIAASLLFSQALLLTNELSWGFWSLGCYIVFLLSVSSRKRSISRKILYCIWVAILVPVLALSSLSFTLEKGIDWRFLTNRQVTADCEDRKCKRGPQKISREIQGEVLSIRYPQPHAMRVALQVTDSAEFSGKTVLDIPHLPWLPTAELKPKDRLRLRAKLVLLRDEGAAPPGIFSYQGYLYRRGFVAMGKLQEVHTLKVWPGDLRSGVRSRILDELTRRYPQSDAWSLISAVVLGHRDHPSEVLWSTFRETGLSHLLVISGFHVGFVFLVVYKILFFIMSRFRVLLLLSLAEPLSSLGACVSAVLYTLGSGGELPAVRAAFVLLLAVFARLLCRAERYTHSLCLAFLFLHLFWPGAGFEAGVQLTFSALLGLLAAGSCVSREKLDKESDLLRGWIVNSLSFFRNTFIFSYFAWLFTLSVQLVWFSSFVPMSTLFNALFSPIFCLLFILGGGICLLLYEIGLPGALSALDLVVWLADGFVLLLEWACLATERFGFGIVKVNESYPYLYALSAAIMAALVYFLLRSESSRRGLIE